VQVIGNEKNDMSDIQLHLSICIHAFSFRSIHVVAVDFGKFPDCPRSDCCEISARKAVV
jgi:hypothetical protein